MTEVFFISLCQIICKPGSVEIDHLSRPIVANRLKRIIFGLAGTNGLLQQGPFLAADRVYLWCTSPSTTVGSYPTRFIVTPYGVVSFLWHFPWGRPRSPLATVTPYAARTFLAFDYVIRTSTNWESKPRSTNNLATTVYHLLRLGVRFVPFQGFVHGLVDLFIG